MKTLKDAVVAHIEAPKWGCHSDAERVQQLEQECERLKEVLGILVEALSDNLSGEILHELTGGRYVDSSRATVWATKEELDVLAKELEDHKRAQAFSAHG